MDASTCYQKGISHSFLGRKSLHQLSCCNGNAPTARCEALDRKYEYNRLLPCPRYSLPARIEHVLVKRDGNVVNIISETLSLPTQYVQDLIDFGAVYRALRCSQPPETANAKHKELFKKFSAINLPEIEGMTTKEAAKTRRVLSRLEELEFGSYLRVHVHPRRFPRCYEVDWASRIIASREAFVVLDKPAGVAVGGSVDNLEEACMTFTARALGLPYRLLLTHQIDNCTEGCVVFARNKEFGSLFNRRLQERDVTKEYLALSVAPVPLGIVSHYMQPGQFAPRLMSSDAHEGWYLCVMDVVECNRVSWPSSSLLSKYEIENCGQWSEHVEHAYECKVKLHTGRTHQIRAQFAAMDAPLLGDTVYMPLAAARIQSDDWSVEIERNWIRDRIWCAPKLTIGLQASHIAWDGPNCTFQAGIPWWREEDKEI